MNSKYLKKARLRLEVAKWSYSNGYLCSAVSNCYYALFNAMQAVVGEPPKGSWTHGGLPKAFTRVVYESRLFSLEILKGFVDFTDELYALRKEADYYDTIMSSSDELKNEIARYISKVEDLLNLLEESLHDVNES
jgi:uncharacterized protein (UPF0332 family)